MHICVSNLMSHLSISEYRIDVLVIEILIRISSFSSHLVWIRVMTSETMKVNKSEYVFPFPIHIFLAFVFSNRRKKGATLTTHFPSAQKTGPRAIVICTHTHTHMRDSENDFSTSRHLRVINIRMMLYKSPRH